MSRFRVRRSLQHIALVIAFTAGLLPVVAATTASAGTCVQPPGSGTSSINQLVGVTVQSAKDVWPVGGASGPKHVPFEPLVLHWNGSRWARVASPNLGTESSLIGISAGTAADLWAVGSFNDNAGMHPEAFHCCRPVPAGCERADRGPE
ncbi:MAG TPA: hypothetical protein VF506_02775 [Streptosporangiaceae bacterium]